MYLYQCLVLSPLGLQWSSRLQEALPRVEDEFEQGFVALSLMELLNQEKLHGSVVGLGQAVAWSHIHTYIYISVYTITCDTLCVCKMGYANFIGFS